MARLTTADAVAMIQPWPATMAAPPTSSAVTATAATCAGMLSAIDQGRPSAGSATAAISAAPIAKPLRIKRFR